MTTISDMVTVGLKVSVTNGQKKHTNKQTNKQTDKRRRKDYSRRATIIRWDSLGKNIEVCKGTRQGGLTSTLLFNLFYKDLIDELSSHEGGISIGSMKFNVFCYADDILIASTTASGLQNLINFCR